METITNLTYPFTQTITLQLQLKIIIKCCLLVQAQMRQALISSINHNSPFKNRHLAKYFQGLFATQGLTLLHLKEGGLHYDGISSAAGS